MGSMLAKGTPVRQITKPIEGTVTGMKVNEDEGVMEYHVESKGADGEPTARWFKEGEIEATGPAPEKAPAADKPAKKA